MPSSVESLALDDANAVIGAIEQRDVANCKVLAVVHEHMIRALISADAAGWRRTANRGMKLSALAVDRARAFDRHVLCIHSEEQSPVAVVERCVAVQRNCVDRMVLLAVSTAQQGSRGRDMKCHVALQFYGADGECSRWNQDCSTAVACAGVDCSLNCSRIDGGLIALGAVGTDVVDASAQVVVVDGWLCAACQMRARRKFLRLLQRQSAGIASFPSHSRRENSEPSIVFSFGSFKRGIPSLQCGAVFAEVLTRRSPGAGGAHARHADGNRETPG